MEFRDEDSSCGEGWTAGFEVKILTGWCDGMTMTTKAMRVRLSEELSTAFLLSRGWGTQ